MKKRQRDADGVATTTLTAMLGPACDNWAEHWEHQPLICKGAISRLPSNLQQDLPSFENLLSVLQTAKSHGGNSSLLMLKDQHPTAAYSSPAAAYLDGCSIIVNHSEAASAGVARVCQSLREDFPHAFGNLYLTPPAAQAVDAHADDRDVLVLQLEGAKEWTVYGEPPCPFPTHREQVGKGGLAVPASATASNCVALRATLHKGDMLYVPRGFVHEASTSAHQPSLHLTLALPSADWSWASLIGGAASSGGFSASSVGFNTTTTTVAQPPTANVQGRAAPSLSLANPLAAAAAATAPMTDGAAALTHALRSERLTDRGEWFWRRSAPPALAAGAAGAEAALAIAESVEAEMRLETGSLRRQLLERAASHNSHQDAAVKEGAACAAELKAKGTRFATPLSMVRRKREEEKEEERRREEKEEERRREEKEERRREEEKEERRREEKQQQDEALEEEESGVSGGGGLLAREQIADALLSSLSLVTTEACCVSSFEDSPLMCAFSKACFAQVLIDSGILVLA